MKHLTGIIFFLLFCVIAPFTFGFEFHGLKSGMTVDETLSYLELTPEIEEEVRKSISTIGEKSGWINQKYIRAEDLAGKYTIDEITLHFTVEKRLWSVTISYHAYQGRIREEAIYRALVDRFGEDNVETLQKSRNSWNVYYVHLIDHRLFNKSVESYKRSFRRIL